MRAIVLAALSVACRSSEPPRPPPPAQVDVVVLAPTTVVEGTEYLATLRSRTAATLQPQVAGQVTAIAVKPGDAVDKGQVLMQIDPARPSAALSQVVASRNAREAQLKLAEQNLARVEQLVATGALPQQELDNARSAALAARADVAALGAQITGTRVELRNYKITAPERGVVGDIPVRVGDLVTPQTQLTTVTDNSTLEANVSIPVERVRDVAVGTQLDILDQTSTVVASGTVSFMSAQVNPETQSVLVKADIANPSNALRADQIVRARVVWRTGQGLRVPALAITRMGGQAFVFVVENGPKGAIAKQRPVQLGELSDNAYVVTKGLAAGEQIVTSGLQKLRDGAPIQPAAPTPAKG